jgi:hypothetical protein
MKTRSEVLQRITITYLATLTSVGELKARGPALLRQAISLAEGVSGTGFSLGFFPLKCALGWGYYSRLWGEMMLPLGMGGLILLYTLVRGRLRREAAAVNYDFLTGCGVVLVFVMFPSATKSLLLGEAPSVLTFCSYFLFFSDTWVDMLAVCCVISFLRSPLPF